MNTVPITELARVIRSKNAGPYLLTADILFKDEQAYEIAKSSSVFTRESIAGLYKIEPESIRGIIFFDPAKAVKITMTRRTVSGSPGDTDIYGAQQHTPLLDMELETYDR